MFYAIGVNFSQRGEGEDYSLFMNVLVDA